MQEFIELLKFALENSSPAIIILCVLVVIIFKSKNILYSILEFKDLAKKRLIQKHEEFANYHDKNFMNLSLKNDYLRLCEESQIQALIGCRYCTMELAVYILSRKDVTTAISLYHRVKGDVRVSGVDIIPRVKMNDSRVNMNMIFGAIFYFSLCFFAFLPLLIPMVAKLFNVELQVDLNWKIIVALFLYVVGIFSIALLILNESLKPKMARKFCSLEKSVRD